MPRMQEFRTEKIDRDRNCKQRHQDRRAAREFKSTTRTCVDHTDSEKSFSIRLDLFHVRTR